jgi:hypothetical protein
MTYQEAKDQVAVKHGHKDWKIAEYRVGRNDIDVMYSEAAELYAKSKWEEACNLQKNMCADDLPDSKSKFFVKTTILPKFEP